MRGAPLRPANLCGSPAARRFGDTLFDEAFYQAVTATLLSSHGAGLNRLLEAIPNA